MTGEDNSCSNGVKVPKGQINYNTVGASAGIASFLGLNARNILGGMNNCGCNSGWNNGCGGGCFETSGVSQIEMNYAQQVNHRDAEIALLKGEKYTDNNIISAYRETVAAFKAEDEKISGIVKDVTSSFIEAGKELAVLNTKVQCLEERIATMKETADQKLDYEIRGVYREIGNTKNELVGAISLESERRACGDKNLYEYVNGTFVPGKLVMPASSVCPQPMAQYNSWTAPTAPTTTPAQG
jgi:hypothetical protein